MKLKSPFVQKQNTPEKPIVPRKEQAFHFGTSKDAPRELGFGTNITEEIRLVNRDGTFNVKRIGLRVFHPYYAMTTMPWTRFNLLVLAAFLTINTFFACLYLLVGIAQLTGINPNDNAFTIFLEIFFFSCQTFTSVGYGRVNPVGLGAGMISSIEALVGLLSLALATGLLFARFSRPEAKLVFSKNALIAPFKEGKAFMFKFANARTNQLIEVEVTLSLSVLVEENGKPIRRFYGLPLENNKVNLFPLSWTIVHPINEESPLRFVKSWEDLKNAGTEVLVNVKAFDDSFSETVYSRISYIADDIVWGAKFPTVFYPEDGTIVLDLSRMSDFVYTDLPAEKQADLNPTTPATEPILT